MSAKTKCGMILFFLLGILASWLIPSLVLALHDTHTISTYAEFRRAGMINQEAVEEWRKRPGQEDYSVTKRMQQIGGMHRHLPLLSWILTGIFVVNILCVVMVGSAPVETGRALPKTRDDDARKPSPGGDIP
jgi:hypothetical protein